MTPGPGNSYRVIPSAALLAQLRTMADRAVDGGLDEQFSDCLRRIQDMLSREPLSWGEIRFHLRHLGLAMCHGATSMLYVRFGVDEGRKLVFIRDILPWSRYDFLVGP